MPDLNRINNTMGKFALHLSNHNSICVSVSGGSDSDVIVHIICTYFREYLPRIHFVFANTGLEYQATLEHLKYIEQRYDITIDRVRGMPIPVAVSRYGVPVISKRHSQYIRGYAFGNAKSYRYYIFGEAYDGNPLSDDVKKSKSIYLFTENQRNLAIAVKQRGIKISSQCCDKSKKAPLIKYANDNNADLSITGERQSEGGSRATSHSSCFEKNNHGMYDKFMPLFFWDDETKAYYKEQEGIRYSDCYEVWGMKRTGCVGCPFNSRIGAELSIIQRNEPKMYKACINVFGESYRLMDEFHIRREPILLEKYSDSDDGQMTLF